MPHQLNVFFWHFFYEIQFSCILIMANIIQFIIVVYLNSCTLLKKQKAFECHFHIF